MGFFSWKCAVSGESLANIHSDQPEWQSKCYLVTPTETIYEPAYEGYGEFGGKDVYALLGDGDREKGIDDYFDKEKEPKFKIKVVLADNYKGQTYDQLEESEDCPYQGYFFPNEEDDYCEECEEDED